MEEAYSNILFLINKENKEITKDIINETLKPFNHKINNMELFTTAFTHSSYMISSNILKEHEYKSIKAGFIRKHPEYKTTVIPKDKNYERIEFLGDSLLKPIITKYIYDRYSMENEGFMSKLRTRIESTETLAQFLEYLKLDRYILISSVLEAEGERQTNRNIKEDVFEAFLGALYLDGVKGEDDYGYIYNKIKEIVVYLIENVINISSLIAIDINYKENLIRACHAAGYPDPVYKQKKIEEVQEQGRTKYGKKTMNTRMFYSIVYVNGVELTEGKGKNQKAAEQNGAKLALEIMKKKLATKQVTEEDDEYEL